ncbi:MAG TPA: hypothetical protein P5026_07215 [Kiritimatiellia bacterium]|nr:hypothetical protein [Kiritimatiellia bacterium]
MVSVWRCLIVSWLAAGALAIWAQGVIVCTKCGREAKTGDVACRHCQEALPKPKADTPTPAVEPVAPASDETEVGRLAASLVEANVRQARELEAKQPELALCYDQNAMALMRLVPAGTFPATVGELIVQNNTRLLNALQRSMVPCRRCGGSGRYQLDLSKVDRRNQGVKAVDGVPCPVCKGAGSVPGLKDVPKAKMQILQGRAEFERRQMVAGDVKVGRVLVPPALDQLLTNKQRALIMTGMPLPCRGCQQSARQACTTCRGSGWKPCDFDECDHGVLKEARKTGVRKETRLNQEAVKKCPRCDGLGEVPCQICKGNGSVACTKCDGSGLAPRCARCSATGLMPCKKCKGTGDVKGEPCPECKGETQMLCPSCRGEGALAR